MDSTKSDDISNVQATIRQHNPNAQILLADSELMMDDPGKIRGKRVLVIEDGPTLTHGEMVYGAGVIAAQRQGAVGYTHRPDSFDHNQ